MIAAVITAAGRGERLGGVAKATLRRRDGSCFLEAIAGSARRAGVAPILVVAGGRFEAETAALAAAFGLLVVRNPQPEPGMASSVAIGFRHLQQMLGATAGVAAPARQGDRGPEHHGRTLQAALLWPVDHAEVRPATVAEVVARATAADIVVPTHGGRGGHPTAFGRLLWDELAGCAALPDGARAVVRRHASRVIRFEVSDPGVVCDVDTRSAEPSPHA